MSRHQHAPQQRALTLTEELERLEQSITLTLQEIDHNFSKAHRIVTSSILPIIEQYAEHSKDVWEGSKFWKQFFEASANVSLSGYEEQPSIQDESEQTVTEDSHDATRTTLDNSESYDTPNPQHMSNSSIEDIDLSNLTLSPAHSTPRPSEARDNRRKDNESPYKSLRRDIERRHSADISDTPRTPSKHSSILDDVAMTPEPSPERQREVQPRQHSTVKKSSDPLLHTILDRNYRIQATPLAGGQIRNRMARTPASAARHRKPGIGSTLDSSPLAPPELHAEVFDSPIRRDAPARQQRVPGVSVLTPRRTLGQAPQRTPGIWDSDDDDDGIDEATGMPYGASPPKTMSFHVPQSRLMKTPAREASKQIVDNILASAGVKRNATGEEEYSEDFEVDFDLEDNYVDENSPSVVRKATEFEDETF